MKYLLAFILLSFVAPSEKRITHRTLAYDDFKGKPIGEWAAISQTRIDYVDKKVNGKNVLVAIAYFVPENSFIRVKTPKVLSHEQLHFDITELYARKIDAFVCGLCGRYDCAFTMATRGQLIDEWRETQAQYDKETNHSLNDSAQAAWREKITQMLNQSK